MESGGAVRLADERKSPHGDPARTLDRALAHDVFDDGVAAPAARSCAGRVADFFDRAGSLTRARANGSVRHCVAMANDHGQLSTPNLTQLKTTFNIIFSNGMRSY
jgi:hypothetical protein